MLTRFYILLLTLCLGLPAAASPLPFKISDETHTYWYYIQFDRNQGNYGNSEYEKHYPLVGYKDATPAKNTTLYGMPIMPGDANLWKVEQGSATDSYILRNKASGLYLAYSGGQFGTYQLSDTPTEIMLPESTNPGFPDSYELCVANLTLSGDGTYTASATDRTYMNPDGGSLVGNRLKGINQGDGGNYLSFVPADLSELTFSYYHFSNMGRGILCDDGTATDETPAPVTVKEGGDVLEADLGCKWTLYLKLLLVSDRGNYLTLDGEQVKVTPLGSNTEPLRLVSDANTYNGSATRTEFVIYNDRTYALGYDLTSVTKQKTDSRFSVLKAYTTYTELTEGIAKHPETAAVPLISTSEETHYYRISLRDKYFNSSTTGANITAVANTSPATPQSTWKLVDDGSGLGQYYIISQYGQYFKWDGTNYVLTSQRSEAAKIRVVLHPDGKDDATLNTKWMLKNTYASGYQYMNWPGGSNDNLRHWNVGDNNNYTVFNAVAVDESRQSLSDKILQPTGMGDAKAIVATDAETTARSLTGSDAAEAYTWSLTKNTAGWVLQNTAGRYLTWDGTHVGSTTVADEAACVWTGDHNTYNKQALAPARLQFRLGADPNKALGVTNEGTLTFSAPYNSRFSLIRPLTDKASVSGAVYPKLSSENEEHWYQFSFLTNGLSDEERFLDATTPTSIIGAAAVADAEVQGWKLVPYGNNGDFYIVNTGGKYLTHATDHFEIKAYRSGAITVFRLVEDEVNRNAFQIVMALSDVANNTLGMASTTDHVVRETTLATASTDCTYLHAEPYTPRTTCYIQFSGWGRTVLTELGDGTLGVMLTEETTPTDPGCYWELIYKASGCHVRNGNGKYLKQNMDGSFTLTASEAEAASMMRTTNTYLNNPMTRWHLKSKADNSVLGLKNGVLTTGLPENSRYTLLRMEKDIRGGKMPALTTNTETKWNYVKMVYHPYRFIRNNRSTQTLTSPLNPLVGYNQKYFYMWSLEEANELGDFYLKNFFGEYFRENSGLKTTTEKGKATVIRLSEVLDRVDGSHDFTRTWAIRIGSGGQYFMTDGGDVTKWGDASVGTKVEFEEVSAESDNSYILFSALSSQPLFEGADGNSPCAQFKTSPDQDQAGFIWIPEFVDDDPTQTRLKSGNGKYITFDGTAFGMSENAAEAYLFNLQDNFYESATKEVRFQLLSSDATQALGSPNVTGGPLEWVLPNSRFSVLRFAEFPSGPEHPVPTTSQTDMTLYYLRFPNSGKVMQDAGAGADIIGADPSASMSKLWAIMPVQTDGQYLGDYIFVSALGNYLKRNGSEMETTANIDEATILRPVEFTSLTNTWQAQIMNVSGLSERALQYANANGSHVNNWIGYGYVSAGTPNNNIFFEKADIYPDFIEEGSGAWRYLQMPEVTDDPVLAVNGDPAALTTETPNRLQGQFWQNIGNEFDFILKNGTGKYLCYDDGGNLILSEDTLANKPAHFYLWLNRSNTSEQILWSICPLNEDGTMPDTPSSFLQRNDDNTLSLASPYPAKTETAELAKGAFFFGENMMPKFSNDTEKTFFFINFKEFTPNNLYLSDGVGDVFDAKGEVKEVRNDMLWCYNGTAYGFKLESKNGQYLCWNQTNQTFDVTKDADQADLFTYLPLSNTHSGCIKLAGGPNTTDGGGNSLLDDTDNPIIGQYLTLLANADGTYDVVLTTTRPEVGLTLEDVVEAEDYTQYRIIPKRSWLVKEVSGETGNVRPGFIQPSEEGWSVNPYTGERTQKTNEFKITIYMKQGEKRQIVLPTTQLYHGSYVDTRVKAYERWYDYKTGGLIPSSRIAFSQQSRRDYANGTVMGSLLKLNGQNSGEFIGGTFYFQMPDQCPTDYSYIVGMDASMYTDFVDYFGDNGNSVYDATATSNEVALPKNDNLIEPTLLSRNIFEIRNAREMADKLMECTKGSTKWLENLTIHFPKKKRSTSTHHCTVPLQNELQNYWFYKEGIADDEHLQNITAYDHIEFQVDAQGDAVGSGENPACIQGFGITDWPVTTAEQQNADLRTKRFINFKYPGAAAATDAGEALGDSCVIKVYARDGGTAGSSGAAAMYQLARIVLYFDEDTEPRPFTEVIGVDGSGNFKDTRSPESLKSNLGQPVASITFDTENFLSYQTPPFGKHTAAKAEAGAPLSSYELTYRYPIQYDNCSYCFQPISGAFNNNNFVVENSWGSYTIAQRFKSNHQQSNTYDYSYYSIARCYNKVYGASYNDPSNSGFLYVDASEQPGAIASIKYDSKLCSGSRLYVSAWICSPNDKNDYPANVIFTVQGRTSDGRLVDLYKYCPGPIVKVSRKKDGSEAEYLDDYGVWQQVFFSFVNNSTEDIREYLLNIDNACTNSSGGDILLDDVEVFASKPEIQVAKTTPVCGHEVTLVKMTSDYVGLLQTLGLEINKPTPNGINPKLWYCLVDSTIYEQTLAASAAGRAEGFTTTDIRNAYYAGLVGDKNSTDPSIYPFHSIELNTMYDDIPEFKYKDALNDTLSTSLLRKEVVDGTKYIVISDRINAEKLKANTKYYLVFVVRYGDDPITYNDAWEQFQMGTDCVIASVFKTAQPFKILGNGDKESSIDDNTIGVCAGQSVQIGMDMEGTETDTGDTEEQITYYDWWLDYVWAGFAKVYITAAGEPVVRELTSDILPSDVGLRLALQNLRHFYPNAVSLSEVTPQQDPLGVFELTTAMIEGLAKLTEPTPDVQDALGNIVTPGHVAPLVLHQSTLNVSIPADITENTKQNITVIPIEPETLDPDVTYCYEPQELHVMVDGKAPGMKDGQTDTAYPTYMTNVPIRLSLTELTQVRVAEAADNFNDVPATQMQVPLRDIRLVNTGSAVGMKELFFNDGGGHTYAPIYLTATNDPDMQVFVATGTGTNNLEMKRVGRITNLTAGTGDANPSMQFYFFKEFQPKEGYTYTIQLNFEEKFPGAKPDDAIEACEGTLVADLKIVPANLIWTGAAGNSDWTNDRNWARADKTELHNTGSYLTNEANKSSNGFVPIHSTNVIITPGANAPDLYAVSANNETEDEKLVDDLNNSASKDIQYELKIQKQLNANNNYACSSFRTYQVKNVVLQPNAELLHTERLNYKKAWMEYALDADRWYTLGVPLKGVYAGDWYAPTATGRQETEYFQDVTFNTTNYDRFSPAVYQRGWDKGEAKLYYLNTPGDPNTVAATPRDVAIRAEWSASYNDVNVYYGEGGFSIKTKSSNKTGAPYSQLLFRVPKEDTSYDYFVNDNPTGSNATGIDRVGKEAGRFFTDDGNGTFSLTATNRVTNNRFFLLGNPLACGLDMTKFFAANTGLEKKYWILTASGQTAVMRGDNATGWVAANGEGTFTTDGILAPGQGFFVKATTPGTTFTANFTPEMQTSAGATQTILRAPASPFASLTPTLQIVASRGNLRSEAIVMKKSESQNDFDGDEDLETLLDATQADAPTVYTMAGHQAATINQRRAMHRLPLGIYSSSDETTLLTFKGLHTFNETLSLLDNLTGEITPLTLNAKNGIATAEVAGNAAGRYFILSSETSTEDVEMDDATDARPIVMADKGKVTITSCSSHPLTFVHVVGTDGRTLYRMTPFTPTLSVPLSPGVYVIECRTDEAVTNAKVTVM